MVLFQIDGYEVEGMLASIVPKIDTERASLSRPDAPMLRHKHDNICLLDVTFGQQKKVSHRSSLGDAEREQ